ncbi:MAG: hypothetical protein QF785_04300 [Phycisphaeraceae bacterium]|jgi:putative peptide zinc metalloprotease protein|nr:hypothetical protein [Phycisphaeraceae bacterium]
MAIDRPTFHESWYRVVGVRPGLRSVVQSYRQHYRGRMWHVLRDPTNNQFFRVNEPAYHFLGLLDGERTVGDAWEVCMDHLGDDAPTQWEAIELLGQLYAGNLLSADLPPDAEGLFARYKKRRRREVGGYLMNLLFARIPIFDPDRILDRWVGVFGMAFTKGGFAVWLAIVTMGAYFLVSKWEALIAGADPQLLLKPENLGWFYVCFWLAKGIHEFGHGFACKRFGVRTHSGGEVHTMGIMFLVMFPFPYVDASSAWAFRSKWHRIMVSAAGMYVELVIASFAAAVWALTPDGTLINTLAYNVIFIASVSTLFFNGNPLLRFDGYYILSDGLEMPNLYNRSKQYLYYLVRKFVYGAQRARPPSHLSNERLWLSFYAIAAAIYRVFIFVGILLYVSDKFFFIGTIFAISGLIGWFVVPIGKWIKYLATSGELDRSRTRAIGLSVVFFSLVFIIVGQVPWWDNARAIGVVEPRDLAVVHVATDGLVESALLSGVSVKRGRDNLIVASNKELQAELAAAWALTEQTDARLRQARSDTQIALAQSLSKQKSALTARIAHIERQIEGLSLDPAIDGQWISPGADRLDGMFVRRGQQIGMIASVDDLIIRAIADQADGPQIEREMPAGSEVTVRVQGRPDIEFSGTIRKVSQAGQEQLPSAALGYLAGGEVLVSTDDPQGRKAAEPFFEVHIDPDQADLKQYELMSGQRVVVRFKMPRKPLIVQWVRDISRMVQQRFKK